MPYIDPNSIIGGYNQVISDWQLGDDRAFTGSPGGPPPNQYNLQPSDNILTDAYFTLKSSPNAPDVDAIIQVHALPNSGPLFPITGYISPPNSLIINVLSAQYESLVAAGPVYYWDFRVITLIGRTYTIATGTVAFLQNVTQTNVAGTPAALPNLGLPRFRGFLPTHPKNIPNFVGVFNVGDYYRNSRAAPGGPSGWVCISPCTDSTGFVTDGIVGNT